MDSEVVKLKKQLKLTIFWIIFLIIAAVGTTYAWFTVTGMPSTNITPMAGTVSEGDTNLLISNSYGGPFDKTCELVFSGNPGSLRPLSTADLTHFYRSAAQNNEGITVLYANADNRVDQDALHGTVYLQCQNASCDVYFNRDELNLGSDAQALAAMRLGMRITSSAGTQTLIFRLDDMGATGEAQSARTIASAGSVVASVAGSGEPVYTSDPSQGIGGYMAQTNGNAYNPGSQKLMTLQAEEVATVEYWLYLEGCDDQCINPVQNRASQLRLAFAGVDNGSR